MLFWYEENMCHVLDASSEARKAYNPILAYMDDYLSEYETCITLTWSPWRLKSMASWLFVQQFVQSDNKENT